MYTTVRVIEFSADFVRLEFSGDSGEEIQTAFVRVPTDRDFRALAKRELASVNAAVNDPKPGDDITPVDPPPVEPDPDEVAKAAFVAMVGKLRALQRAVGDKIIVEGDAETARLLGEIKTAIGEHPEYKELL